jgi:hypothetical protein
LRPLRPGHPSPTSSRCTAARATSAVGRYLARDQLVNEQGGTVTRHEETHWKATVSDLGVIDAISVSWSGSGPSISDVTVHAEVGAHSPKLQALMAGGATFRLDLVHD